MSTADLMTGIKHLNGKQHLLLSGRHATVAYLRECVIGKGRPRLIFLTTIACFCLLLSQAQPSVKTTVDKSEILIGDQFKLTIEASLLPEEYKINWPVVPDSLQHFEVVNRGKMDSVYNDNRLTGLVQTLTITSFDSGKWVLPSFMVNITPAKGDTSYNFFTDSIPITVSFSASDSTSQLRDIKPIREVETINPVWYWIGGGMLLVALIVLSIWLYRYWKKKKPKIITSATSATPYDEAMKELENLKTYNLSVAAEIKTVHTRLGEILKRYLSRSQQNNYLNKTTGDVLISLSYLQPDKTMLAKAAASLRCSDAVKFAKYLPPADESAACMHAIKEIIDDVQQTINNKQKAQAQTLNPKP